MRSSACSVHASHSYGGQSQSGRGDVTCGVETRGCTLILPGLRVEFQRQSPGAPACELCACVREF